MRGPTGTVTQRKGGATWRDIGQLFYKASRGGPRKPMSMATPIEIIKKETESPSEFYKMVGEGEGGMIWENGIETCIISYMK